MRVNKKSFCWVGLGAFALLLGGCDKKVAPPLVGKRVSLMNALSLKEIKGESVQLPCAEVNKHWLQRSLSVQGTSAHLKLSKPLRKIWEWVPSSSTQRVLTSPIITQQGGLIALCSDGYVRFFRLQTGEVVWANGLCQSNTLGGGVCSDGKGNIFVTTGDRKLICLQESSGQKMWEKKLDSLARESPVAYGDKVFVLTVENGFQAFDARSGNLLWEKRGAITETMFLGCSSPAIWDEKIFVAFPSGEVSALSIDTGEVLWSYNTAGEMDSYQLSYIMSPVVVDQGRVFVFDYSDQLCCLQAQTGEVLWKKPLGGLTSLCVMGNFLLCVRHDDELFSLSLKTGDVFWKSLLPKNQGERSQWIGYHVVDNTVRVLRKDGAWLSFDPFKGGPGCLALDFQASVTVPPIIAHKHLCLVTEEGIIQVFRSP